MGKTVGEVGRGAVHWRDGWGGIPGCPRTGISLVSLQEKEKDENPSLKQVVRLSVPPGIHNFLLILTLFSRLRLYFDSTSVWEGRGHLEKKNQPKPNVSRSSGMSFPL